MPRPRLSDPPQEISVNLPTSLLARIDLYLVDPMRGQVRYGARSKLIVKLLSDWAEAQEGRAHPQAQPISNSEEGTPL